MPGVDVIKLRSLFPCRRIFYDFYLSKPVCVFTIEENALEGLNYAEVLRLNYVNPLKKLAVPGVDVGGTSQSVPAKAKYCT